MKRTVGILAGIGILGAVGYFGGQLWAQQPQYQPQQPIRPVSAVAPAQPGMAAGTAPALRTRIALINLAEVMKNYKKAKAISDQVNVQAKTIDTNELQPIRTQLIQLRNQLQQQPNDPALRERVERDARKLQLDLQEKEEDARKRMTKLGGDYMVQLYREVEDAVKFYARSNDIELVLFFMDPTDAANPYDPATVQAKLQTRGALPMYAAPNMDVTAGVVGMLNQRYAPGQVNSTPAAGVPGQPH